MLIFFFSSRRRHTRLQGDWSSDVCSSDLSYTRFTSQAIALSDVRALNRTLAAGTGFHILLGVVMGGLALALGPAALGIVVPAGSLAAQARTVFSCTLATVLLRTLLSAYRGVVAGAQRIA